MQNPMLDAALAYAARGWHVFPIAAGTKVPRTANGFHDATTDGATIRLWWEGKPHLNVGIAMGEVSGIWALDIDGEDGAMSIMDLEHEHGELPVTPTFRTPRGGRQHLFNAPAGVVIPSLIGIMPGLDTRGNGGYSVVPPSTRPEGPYKFLNDVPVADAPAWLIEFVTATGATAKGLSTACEFSIESTSFRDHPGAGEGTRNRDAARLAGCELAKGTPAATVLADAIAWAGRCRPPMALAELSNVIGSIAGRESAKPEPATEDDDYVPADIPTALPGTIDESTWQRFPVECLPEVAAEYVVGVADAMSTDPAMVAVPMLGAMAGAIGNALAIRLDAEWVEPAILWMAIVADSGTGKTPGHEKALQFVTGIDALLESQNKEDSDRYKLEYREYEAALAAWKSASRSREGTSEPPPAEPAKPITRTVTIGDTTPEAVAVVLSHNPRGVLLERDELSAWLGGFDRYRSGGGNVSTEAAIWLSLHNGRPIKVDRRSSERIRVERATVSIAGGIQPRILTRAIGDEHQDNGLLPRFLMAAPPRRRKQRKKTTVPPRTVERLREVFKALHELPAREDGPTIIPMGDSAEEVWAEFYERHADRQFTATGVVASLLAKIEAAAGRLALVIHAARVAAGEPIDRHAIDGDSMRRGITLAEWFADEWLRVRGIGEVSLSPDATTALEKIKEAGGTIADRELRTCSRRLKDAKTRGEAIAELVAAGIATTAVDDTTGGRPAVSITLVPRHEPVPRSHKFEKPDECELMGTGNARDSENTDHLPGQPSGRSRHGRIL